MNRIPDTRLNQLRSQPFAAELLAELADETGAYLVGGAVRDLLLDAAHVDYDLAYEGDAIALAERLASRLGGEVRSHERFGTATVFVAGSGLVVDLAATRRETYAAPGALPDVTPADLETDLLRRDFTINAIAMSAWADRFGELHEASGAQADLAARLMRVLHDESFIDDPTRLLRLLRYGARFGFSAEPHTEQLAREAIEGGAPGKISGGRIRDELLDLLGERQAVVAIDSMAALGLDRAIHPSFCADEYLAARSVLNVTPSVRQDLVLLAVCSRKLGVDELSEWLEHLSLRAGDREIVTDVVEHHAELSRGLSECSKRSDAAALLDGHRPETAVLAAALPTADAQVHQFVHDWLDERESTTLLITGSDLRAAGLAEGPTIGRALTAVLAKTRDGEISGREDQLSTALAFAASEHDHESDPS